MRPKALYITVTECWKTVSCLDTEEMVTALFHADILTYLASGDFVTFSFNVRSGDVERERDSVEPS